MRRRSIRPAFRPSLKRFAQDLHRAPTEARYLRTRSGGVFGVTASRLGRALDVEGDRQRRRGGARRAARGVGDGQGGQGQDDGRSPRSSRRTRRTRRPRWCSRWAAGRPTTPRAPTTGSPRTSRSPRTGSMGLWSNPERCSTSGTDRRSQLPDRLPPRWGDRRRSLGRGQGPGRWDLRHVDDALQRRRASRSPDRDPLTALVLHPALSARPGCHGLGIAVDALPQRHEAPGPDQGLRVAGHGPLRDLERPERPDGLLEPAQRQQRRRRL